MPSFAFISTLALALLSAAPSMAQTPPRGRPNHADLFGYPHNLPKVSRRVDTYFLGS